MEIIKRLILAGLVIGLVGCTSNPPIVTTRNVYVVPEVPQGLIDCPSITLPASDANGQYTDSQVSRLLQDLSLRGDLCERSLIKVIEFYNTIRKEAESNNQTLNPDKAWWD